MLRRAVPLIQFAASLGGVFWLLVGFICRSIFRMWIAFFVDAPPTSAIHQTAIRGLPESLVVDSESVPAVVIFVHGGW